MIFDLKKADCLEILSEFSDNSVDLIVTDPPYRCISGGKPHKKGQPSGMLSLNDGKVFAYNDIKPEQWFPELFRVLKPDSHCYIMVNTLNLELYLRLAREVGFQLHNVLVWQKNNVTPSRWYMKNGEYTLFLRKGKAKTINNLGSKTVHSFQNITGKKVHPTEKPVELMKYYIENSSHPCDTVLDPFMGSGSTGVAAVSSGRNFIGIEIDGNYFEIANERIKRAYSEYELNNHVIYT